jgi:hypothetical protein
MPLLLPGDPEFRGFDVGAPFASRLHSEHIITGGAVSEFYANLAGEQSAWNQWENFSAASRHAIANVAITDGLQLDRLGALSVLFAEAPQISAAAIGKMVQSDVLSEALVLFDESLSLVATQTPVVGWVVQLGLFVYDLIKMAVLTAKAQPDKKAQAKAIAYRRGADEDLTRAMLDRLKDPSWTLLFLPQGYPEDVIVKTIAYTERGFVDGLAWEVGKPGAGNWGWGLTPGLSSRFAGCVGGFQSPFKLFGSTRDAGFESITGFGEMVPSVVQLGLAVWQMVLKNSPNAFRIKGAKIVRAWHDYYGVLHNWAITGVKSGVPGRNEWIRKQITYSSQWYLPQFEASVVDGYEPDDLPSEYTQANVWWYSELIAYVIEQLWKPRLSGFLETITCAYVPPNAQALNEDPALRDKHDEMRRLLLTHAARHEVELDLIPDADYRAAMKVAQLQVDPTYTTAKRPPRRKWLDFITSFTPEPPAEPEGDLAPGLPPLPPPSGGSGALVAVGLGLGLAGLVAARRAR